MLFWPVRPSADIMLVLVFANRSHTNSQEHPKSNFFLIMITLMDLAVSNNKLQLHDL